MESRKYTAQDYRQMVCDLENNLKHGMERVVIASPKLIDMVRQAAEMRERCEEILKTYSAMPCEKCAEGEIEPDCPYYGEPCGCNSPTFREFRAKHIAVLDYILNGDAGKDHK